MRKLNASQLKRRNEILNKLEEKERELRKEIWSANAEIERLLEDVKKVVDEYNDVVDEAEAWCREIVVEIQNEKWRESDDDAIMQWKDEFDTFYPEQAEIEPLEIPDFEDGASEQFGSIPVEAE